MNCLQFHVGYSETIEAVGSWAGVAPLCYAFYFLGCIETPSLVSPSLLTLETELLADLNRIDEPANVQDDQIFIYHGTNDDKVAPGAADVIYDYYAEFVTDPSAQIQTKTDLPSTHCIASDHNGTPCGETNEELYIENCEYERRVGVPVM